MVTFNYDKDQEILVTLFIEKVTQEEIIDYIHSMMSKADNFPKNLKVLIDASKGSLALHPGQLYNILDENIKMFSHYNTLKVAIVLESPIDTALAVIYARLIQIEYYQFHVFNTTMAASAWLKKGVNESNHTICPNTSSINNTT